MTEEQWLASLPAPWRLSEENLSEVLPQFMARYPVFEDRLRALAHWRLGTPYRIFQVGEETPPDTNPVFRLDVSDCTVHVLTSLSLAQSRSWQEARQNMIAIHYKPDDQGIRQPAYERRWHFTTDRLMHHPSTPDISAELVPPERMAVQHITLNRKADGSEHLKLGWQLTADVRYIPNDLITPQLLKRLPAITGVAFVKAEIFENGIIAAHEGMIVDQQYLLHASQLAGETVKEDFMQYYFPEDGPRYTGIMLYRFLPLDTSTPTDSK